MLCADIINKIESIYPIELACEWDNVGLLVGRTDKEVKRIYIALDASKEVIERAISEKADMLITHHPLIFSPLKKLTNEEFVGSRVVALLQHDISYYAMHTNYDVKRMAALASDMLSLEQTEVLQVTTIEFGKEEGIGKIGRLPYPVSLEECCHIVKEKFDLSYVKVFGKFDDTILRIAIVPGSGKSAIDTAISMKADVLITGDIDHHSGIDAIARGLCIIDAGHYGIEHIFMEDIARFCRSEFSHIKTITEMLQQPFHII
ncbi:Nif3-like dinuclear metal center hexameric protein [Lachnospiraceae bacterium LCP25S3_G4]